MLSSKIDRPQESGHGHSHAIPQAGTGDSGFEVRSFVSNPHPPPRQLLEAFSSFSQSLSTLCLRG